ncbi:hypothetical protein F7Q99_39725 [Streptomyces kaniharaensis]|uniref:Uncharacterized protein n=1 Tax=Streptomyces kaniharaensis TaxID=212423 RepID=A0A6N7L2I5_9ACTN|nr:hypothetical protein [Streptomyces kaniharaensis]MQS18000.1 hypothetical protein [Streptomyces kaniharaensis]MQS18153.1 hypothetical protein [Streptomyces kaniharaensis]
MAFGWIKKVGSAIGGATRKTTGAIGGAARRVTGREKPPTTPPEAAAPPAPPTPPTGPPSPPAGPPQPPSPGEGPEGAGGEEAGLTEEQLREAEEAAAEAEREEAAKEMARKRAARPGTLFVAILGKWKISETKWTGTARGHLQGQQVHDFLDAMDKANQEAAVMVVAEVYADGRGFDEQLKYDESEIFAIDYDHSAHGDYDASQDPSIE